MTDVYCNKCYYYDESEYSGSLCCHYSNVKIRKTSVGVQYNKVSIHGTKLNCNNDCPNYKGYNILSSLLGDGCSYIVDNTFVVFNILAFMITFAAMVAISCESSSPIPFIIWVVGIIFTIKYYLNNYKKYCNKINLYNTPFTTEDPIWDEIASHMNPPSSPKAEEELPILLDRVESIVDRREL